MRVAINGQSATFPCSSGGGQHGTVPGIVPGGTGFTVTGLANGAVVARADGQALATANTTTPFPVDLALVGGPQGASVAFTWTFDDQVGQVFGCSGCASRSRGS